MSRARDLADGTFQEINIPFSGADDVNSIRIEGSNGSSERYALDIVADGENTRTDFKIGSGGGAPATKMSILSGGGISFNGDTAAANALDDYEVGTFEVTLSPQTSGTITIQSSADTLAYTKIGRLVTVTGMISVTSTGSAVGNFVYLNNLPFASADLTEFAGRGTGYVVFDDDSVGTRTPIGTFMIESSTQIRLYINAASVAGSDNFYASFSYTTT